MARSNWWVVGLWALAGAGVGFAAEIYVDAGSAAGDGIGSRDSPFRTVQAAIGAADNGDEILVAAGTYVENLRVEGKSVILRGGYSSRWERDGSVYTTTLAGAGGDAVINLIASDATVDGFRITGGTGSTEELPYGYHGGGIYSRDGSPTISNNLIEGNDIRSSDPPSDYNLGGGVMVSGAASASILNNVIRGNLAGRGGGLAVLAQAVLIEGNTIEKNVAVGDHGGGLYIAAARATITRNIIRGNEVGRELGYGWGGGLIVFNTGTSAELSFNVVYENFAAAYGAGEFIDEGAEADIHHELIFRNASSDGCEAVSAIAVDGGEGVGSRATIRHCTVVGNVCENSVRGNGLQVEGGSTVAVTNSIFWSNGGDDFAQDGTAALSVSYTCSQEPFDGPGNINADPRFADASADDYHLAAGSPCIDAGDPDAPYEDEPADNGGRADMGRYGNAADAPTQTPELPSGGTAEPQGEDSDPAPQADASGDEADGADPSAVSGSLLCPGATALLLSASLLGVRRPRPRSLSRSGDR